MEMSRWFFILPVSAMLCLVYSSITERLRFPKKCFIIHKSLKKIFYKRGEIMDSSDSRSRDIGIQKSHYENEVRLSLVRLYLCL